MNVLSVSIAKGRTGEQRTECALRSAWLRGPQSHGLAERRVAVQLGGP